MNSTVICWPFNVLYSPEAVQEFYVMNIVICVLNSVLAVTITFANSSLLLAILGTPSLRTPSYLLVCSLAVTDVGVGLVIQPLYIWRKMAEMRGDVPTFCALYMAGNVLAHLIGSPSFFTATALSCDRYLAISLGVRYRQKVTTRRILRLIAGLWFLAVFVVIARFYSRKPKYMSIAAALLFVCLLIIMVCYVKAMRLLRSHSRSSLSRDIRKSKLIKYKHSLFTMLLVVICLFCCYLPFVFVHIVGSVSSKEHALELKRARELTTTVLFGNSLVNPLIYLMRSKELRQAFRRSLGRLFCRVLRLPAVHVERVSEYSTDAKFTTFKAVTRNKLCRTETQEDMYL
ncbi:predicted protein [Nematostella vectensis]|uniref:G-protein coupled receptors family 1 profile domain-containing protein n=1 Tax=Nematostella vectensis TaxID=45351 RepID=A7S0P4_NEMVE|nr:predicted protein [Nematostella vectensis]|eukprot:XP_001634836.1 predicted protein [Nematostella vectensis]